MAVLRDCEDSLTWEDKKDGEINVKIFLLFLTAGGCCHLSY